MEQTPFTPGWEGEVSLQWPVINDGGQQLAKAASRSVGRLVGWLVWLGWWVRSMKGLLPLDEIGGLFGTQPCSSSPKQFCRVHGECVEASLTAELSTGRFLTNLYRV